MNLIKANLDSVILNLRDCRGSQICPATIAIKRFLRSSYACAECVFDKDEYDTAKKAYKALYSSIRNHKSPCFVKRKADRVFLFKAGVTA